MLSFSYLQETVSETVTKNFFKSHLAVRVYPANAQMTSRCGKNKEVCYEPQASSVTDVLTAFDVLCALSEYTRAAKWNLFIFHILLISVIPHKIRNVFKNLRSVDLRAKNFEAHYVIRTSTLITNSPRSIKTRVFLCPLYTRL